MGIASASFTIWIRDEAPLSLAENLLRFLETNFLQPKSVEIHLPGRYYKKIPHSIDGALFWGREDLPSQLPGEQILANTEFTTLEHPDSGLTLSRDASQIMNTLSEYADASRELWERKLITDDDVYWTFWGLCRIAYNPATSMPQKPYVLRQKLHQAQRWEPILRITSHLCRQPRPVFTIRLLIRSFIWSHYTSYFDATKSEWIPKSLLKLEQENATQLAEIFSQFVRQYPNAEIEWDHEQQHSPDLRGFLPFEFQARLGARQSPQRVRDLENIS